MKFVRNVSAYQDEEPFMDAFDAETELDAQVKAFDIDAAQYPDKEELIMEVDNRCRLNGIECPLISLFNVDENREICIR